MGMKSPLNHMGGKHRLAPATAPVIRDPGMIATGGRNE